MSIETDLIVLREPALRVHVVYQAIFYLPGLFSGCCFDTLSLSIPVFAG